MNAEKTINLDAQEVKIVRELIRNSRVSDNQISKNTKIPVMTVNRKRKRLEESGLIHYNTYLRVGDDGLGLYHARQLYILKFRSGITTAEFIEYFKSNPKRRAFNSQFVIHGYLGEKDGQLALMLINEAHTETELVEDFNGILIPQLKKQFGDDCIDRIDTVNLSLPLRTHHNYMPLINMENGKIKDTWPDEYIFVNAKQIDKDE
ncbi:MAG: winged helix-turn-helix domain-containing protein [Candidatus Woesearchaeota archaeon]